MKVLPFLVFLMSFSACTDHAMANGKKNCGDSITIQSCQLTSGSTAQLFIKLDLLSFEAYWAINSTNAARCFYSSGTVEKCEVLSSPYENRTESRGDFSQSPVQLELNITVETNDFLTEITLTTVTSGLVGSVTYQVKPDCCGDFNSAFPGLNSSLCNSCGLDCTLGFPCEEGQTGWEEAVCQDDTTFKPSDNCTNVECQTTDLECDLSNTTVTYGELVDCDGLNATAWCNSTGGWDVVYIPANETYFDNPTGIKVVGTNATLSCGIYPTDFEMVFQISGKDVASCQYTLQSNFGNCSNLSSDFAPRTNATVVVGDVVRFEIMLNDLKENDGDVTMKAIAFGLQPKIHNKTFCEANFLVVEDCSSSDKYAPSPVDVTTDNNCRLAETCTFQCKSGFIGGATGICQPDGTYLFISNTCVIVQCDTTSLQGCGNCTEIPSNGTYNYTDVLDLNCELPGTAFCNSTGAWNNACVSPNNTLTLFSTDNDTLKAGSSAKYTIGFHVSDLEISWKINKTNLAKCQFWSVSNTSQCTILQNKLQNRTSFSVDLRATDVIFVLLINPLRKSDDNSNISVWAFSDANVGQAQLNVEEIPPWMNTAAIIVGSVLGITLFFSLMANGRLVYKTRNSNSVCDSKSTDDDPDNRCTQEETSPSNSRPSEGEERKSTGSNAIYSTTNINNDVKK